jgi:bla regulator protein BlaR1
MNSYLASIGTSLANHLWQSTAFALVVWLLTLALRKNQAHLRHALWLAASIKFLIPFSLLISAGNLLPHPKQPVAPTLYSAMDVVEEPFEGLIAPPAIVLSHVPTLRERAGAILPGCLGFLWLIGVCSVFFGWWHRWRVLTESLRQTVPAIEGRELEILRRLEIRLFGKDHSKTLPLLMSAERMEPGVFGIFRPALVWPVQLSAKLGDEHVEAIVIHELTHVRRRDNLTSLIHMLVEVAFWFHPLVWWIERQMVKERERACDETVANTGGSAEMYAESLLKTCRFCIESPLTYAAGVTGGDLRQRVAEIVTRCALPQMTWPKKVLVMIVAMCVMAVPVMLGLNMPGGQSAAGDWEQAAGGKQAFEVASVRESKSNDAAYSNFSLDTGNAYSVVSKDDKFSPSGGYFSARNQTLLRYIIFAYKLSGTQELSLRFDFWSGLSMHVPAWVRDDRFDVTARAAGSPTKDQMRLMMQSLLVERFKLVVHKESRQTPVFSIAVEKPGTLGPQLHVHSASDTCETTTSPDEAVPAGSAGGKNGALPIPCGMIARLRPSAPGRNRIGGRGVTMAMVAESLPPQTGLAVLSKPVIDGSGLSGTFDFSLEWAQPTASDMAAGPNAEGEAGGPSFAQAMKEQLGLKLESTKGLVEMLVIDKVERPSEN